jgi:hypothetical protein
MIKGTATTMQKDLNSQINAAITSSNDKLPYTVCEMFNLLDLVRYYLKY